MTWLTPGQFRVAVNVDLVNTGIIQGAVSMVCGPVQSNSLKPAYNRLMSVSSSSPLSDQTNCLSFCGPSLVVTLVPEGWSSVMEGVCIG